jgi:hypothetical protein
MTQSGHWAARRCMLTGKDLQSLDAAPKLLHGFDGIGQIAFHQ